jgi:hypothetical protein
VQTLQQLVTSQFQDLLAKLFVGNIQMTTKLLGQHYSNTASTITVSNLSKTREYRAVIVSGPCASANSTIVKITVIPTVDAVITGAPQICPGQTALFNVLVTSIAANDNWSLLYRVNGTLQTALTGKGPGNFPLSVGPPLHQLPVLSLLN